MKIEKLTDNTVKYTFEVSVADFDHALEHAFDHVKKDVVIDGFRKGHVTRAVYNSKVGVETLYEDAINHVLQHKIHDATNEGSYRFVGDPRPSLDWATISTDKPFEISVEFDVVPEVVLGNYKGVEVEAFDNNVTEEEVTEVINNMLTQGSTLEPKLEGSLENGDTAIFDFEGFDQDVAFEGGKGVNHELEIGSGQFIPGFEEQMIGMILGEEKDLDITFPEEYHAEELAGKPVVFKVKLNDMKVKSVQELNDEWVVALGKDEKTVAELQAKVKADLIENKERSNKNKAIEAALVIIAENSTVVVPEELVATEAKKAAENYERQIKEQYGLELPMFLQLSGMDEEQFNNDLKLESQGRLLNSLIIEAIAKKEAFDIPQTEIDEKYEELATYYQMPVEEIKVHINDQLILVDLQFAKAVDFIFDNLKFI